MSDARFDQLSRSLARSESRRWLVKAMFAGAIGVGMVARGSGSSEAQEADMFQQCMAACLAPCNGAPVCPNWEACAASCSQALW